MARSTAYVTGQILMDNRRQAEAPGLAAGRKILRNVRKAFAGITLMAVGVDGRADAIAVSAQEVPGKPDSAQEALFDLSAIRLWSGRAPEARSDDPAEVPTLTIFRPPPGSDNGTAIIVAPGGGYIGLSLVLEGRQVADWFTSRGITAFVLKYRTGPRARLPVPLLDGARAVRYVRANAARLRIAADRIGMIGFSAGGHLAASIAAEAASANPASPDPVERVSARPNFVVLAYPWLNATVVSASRTSQYSIYSWR